MSECRGYCEKLENENAALRAELAQLRQQVRELLKEKIIADEYCQNAKGKQPHCEHACNYHEQCLREWRGKEGER